MISPEDIMRQMPVCRICSKHVYNSVSEESEEREERARLRFLQQMGGTVTSHAEDPILGQLG